MEPCCGPSAGVVAAQVGQGNHGVLLIMVTENQQPWTHLAPGMTFGPYGINFERTNTWWNESPAWLQYVTRSQYLLGAM